MDDESCSYVCIASDETQEKCEKETRNLKGQLLDTSNLGEGDVEDGYYFSLIERRFG
jgi:hypothetical protein